MLLFEIFSQLHVIRQDLFKGFLHYAGVADQSAATEIEVNKSLEYVFLNK